MDHKIKHYISFLLLGILSFPITAQLSIKTDRLNAQYEVGELMHFIVETTEAGNLEYNLRYDDRSKDLLSGNVNLEAGETFKIPFTSDDPDFILCEVSLNGALEYASAAFSPFDILPLEEEPDDLDAFWDGAKAELAAVPMDPQLSVYNDHETDYSITYRVNLGNIDNRRVYGYLSVPKTEGPFPAILVMPSFGDAANHVRPRRHLAELGGALAFTISIHDIEPDEYDPDSYTPNESDDPNTIYYKYALLGAVRAIDYIFSRPDFNGVDMGVVGTSQGGGLSILVAGLDQRVNLLVNNIAALSQHLGLKYGKAGGHPYYVHRARTTQNDDDYTAATLQAVKYYDTAYFARRFNGPSYTLISYEDVTCPPATIFAAYNQLKGPKILQHARDLGHENPDFNIQRLEFFRVHFEGSLTPPRPDSEMKIFYTVDAGEDTTTSTGGSIDLNGSVTLDTVAVTDGLIINWSLIKGPGRAIFSDPTAFSTSVQFDTPGEYLIQFSAHDNRELEERARVYTLTDFVKVIVE